MLFRSGRHPETPREKKKEIRLPRTTSPLSLRKRARSSEGFVLSNRIDDFHEESHSESINNYQERNQSCIFAMNMKDRITEQNGAWSEPNKNRLLRTGLPNNRFVIPIEHPFKIAWDVLTLVLSIAHSYLTHMAIRDRQFDSSPFISFCQAWFFADILLNFFTESKTNTGEIISDHRRIVARYLTSWFAVDILSLFPWEVL